MTGRAILAGALLLAGLACAGAPDAGSKPVLGAVERIRVREAGLEFLARIDTGAGSSAIHAVGIRLADAPPGTPVRGRPVAFTVANERGETRRLSAVVADVARVRTAAGSEERLRVELHLAHGETERRVRVSLRDRSGLPQKLLVGRDWLDGAFVVDVSRPPAP